MKDDSWNLVLTASDKGPMASATPIRRNARKIGRVLNFIGRGVSPYCPFTAKTCIVLIVMTRIALLTTRGFSGNYCVNAGQNSAKQVSISKPL
jgi:hypothetical protein